MHALLSLYPGSFEDVKLADFKGKWLVLFVSSCLHVVCLRAMERPLILCPLSYSSTQW